MPVGFLYVLINPSMPDLAKVGKTTRDPLNRVAELSSATGVPSPFMLAFQQPVAECDSAEVWVHRELERAGYRHTDNREFFNAPLHEIIQVVIQAANLTPVAAGETVEEELERDMASPECLAEELCDLAAQYQSGTDRMFKNDKKALEVYEQAAALGHSAACVSAGQYYEHGSDAGIREDREKSLTYYQKAVQLAAGLPPAKLKFTGLTQIILRNRITPDLYGLCGKDGYTGGRKWQDKLYRRFGQAASAGIMVSRLLSV